MRANILVQGLALTFLGVSPSLAALPPADSIFPKPESSLPLPVWMEACYDPGQYYFDGGYAYLSVDGDFVLGAPTIESSDHYKFMKCLHL